tara:strand:- start:7086 stop:8966 length:1881 start_codon:yes stop_codon:yes gene_type:complete
MIESPSLELLSEKLFQLGHEHEVQDNIFDMDITPNRGDCLSLLGLARDLNIFFGLKEPFEIYDGEIDDLDLDFKNLSPSDCPKISFLEIEVDGEVSEYKEYLKNYFSILGNNKTNFFTDISNYISYELGQPTHCFDRDCLKDKLIFENKVCSESFKTLLGSSIELQGKNCIFETNNKIISLAGVMGGESTACNPKTKKVLIECAYFNPETIIGKSLKYNLNSDAAHKFERGVDIRSHDRVLRRFIKIVQDHVLVKNIKLKSISEKDFDEPKLKIDVNRINKILGINLKKDDFLSYLEKLGFKILNEKIIPPSYRSDIESQNDLAEEVARIIGFNNIESKPIKLKLKEPATENKRHKIENFLIKNGFTEVINFPFSSRKKDNSIMIDNPLDSNKNNLRTTLKDSLIENLLFNERRQKDSIKLFELSDIYTKDNQINQSKVLGIIISGRRGLNYSDFSKKLDKNYLDLLLNDNYGMPIFDIIEIPRDKLKTKKKDKIFYTEILIDSIPKQFFDNKSELNKEFIEFFKYRPVSEYPSSIRDFSFSISDPKKYPEVISLIENLNDENLKESFIFDFFINEKMGEIKVGVRLIFQSGAKTLSEAIIQKSILKILTPIMDIDGVLVPGFDLK